MPADFSVLNLRIRNLSREDVTIGVMLRKWDRGDFTGYLDMLENLVIALATQKKELQKELVEAHKNRKPTTLTFGI